MDLKTRIDEIRARIDALRKIVDRGDSNSYSDPKVEVEEQFKPKSSADDFKAKLMKK